MNLHSQLYLGGRVEIFQIKWGLGHQFQLESVCSGLNRSQIISYIYCRRANFQVTEINIKSKLIGIKAFLARKNRKIICIPVTVKKYPNLTKLKNLDYLKNWRGMTVNFERAFWFFQFVQKMNEKFLPQ